jgi:hypothetical protein
MSGSSNKFLSFGNDGISNNSSSTFIVAGNSKIQSVEIKSTDQFIVLPDPMATDFDVIQYRKLIQTERDIIFTYGGLQIGKIYFNRNQTIKFHKFNSALTSNWIC